MTDFLSDPGPYEPDLAGDAFWSRSSPARAPAAPAPTPAVRSSASVALAVHQLLEGLLARRVPRLEVLRQRLEQAECSWDARELEQALRALRDACESIDFLAGRGGSAQAATFREQGATLGAAARRVGSLSLQFAGRHAGEAAMARLLWIDLGLETRSIDKRVAKGLAWLEELEGTLAAPRGRATSEVAQAALKEVARRARSLEDRLHKVEGVCGAARAARPLGDQLANARGALFRTLQERVRPASLQLQHRLLPLLDAAGGRGLETAELLLAIEARHALQVALTQGAAEAMLLHGLHGELAAQLAWIETRARALA